MKIRVIIRRVTLQLSSGYLFVFLLPQTAQKCQSFVAGILQPKISETKIVQNQNHSAGLFCLNNSHITKKKEKSCPFKFKYKARFKAKNIYFLS